MRIAVVGSGISGLVAAHRLHPDHDITLFEARDRIGGHTHTVTVEEGDRRLGVDTGFIVFNQRNYPRFSALLEELGVAHHESDMSFSVRNERTGLEYRGSSLNTLFAQRGNLFRPSFYRMVADIVRFYREAPRAAAGTGADVLLGDYLRNGGYSRSFAEDHILPMTSALWSSGRTGSEAMPLGFLVRFFANHGMLQFRDRPQWRVVTGGSSRYADALIRPFRDRIRLGAPVTGLRRNGGLRLRTDGNDWERFDHVILATHSDQALGMLDDAGNQEREILGAMRYEANQVVLHTDTSLLPRRRLAWSSWNYHVGAEDTDRSTVTYLMNKLQVLDASRQYMVTLNRSEAIDPAKVLRRLVYHHPIFDAGSVAAQARIGEICGRRGVSFCGAYLGFGFHEDGVRSAESAVARIPGLRRAA